jgi:hypothetical protein
MENQEHIQIEEPLLVDEKDFVASIPKSTPEGVSYMSRRYIKRGQDGADDIYQFSTNISQFAEKTIIGKAVFGGEPDEQLPVGEQNVSINGEAFDQAEVNLVTAIQILTKK